ncbi:MAG: MFS transporter [Candidatus Dormibacteria bacterium]
MAVESTTEAPSAPPASAASKASQHRRLALAVICAAQLMVVLDATIVNVALPSIQRALHIAAGDLVWVTTAYSVTFGGLLIFGGRTGDLFGRRRMFMAGIAIFSAASLLGGFATGSIWLIAARAAQGVGGAIASPTALSLIATNFEEGAARNRAMGVYAAMSGAGGAVGLLAGGVLTDLASWRWVLFVNVPIGALVLFLAPRVLQESAASRGRLDWRGALLITGGMALLVYGLTNAATNSWTSPETLATLGAAGVLILAFVATQALIPYALMPLHIFRNRNRSGAYATMLCTGAALFALFFFVTLFLQDVEHYSPLRTGVSYLPFAATIGVMAQVSARLVSRLGARTLIPAGALLIAGGLWWLSHVTAATSYPGVLAPLEVIAVGMGIVFVPLTLTALSGVQARESGIASALLNSGQQVGGSIGLAALSTIAVSAIHSRLQSLAVAHHGVVTPHLVATATTYGYTRGFLIGSAIALVGMAVALVAIRGRGGAGAAPTARGGVAEGAAQA